VVSEGREASLLRAGADAIGQWRLENPDGVIAAERVIVSDLDLSGADLSGANLAGGRFLRCNLRHVSFADADLQTVEFNNCVLEDTEFRGADLKAASITAKSLDGARFGGSPTLGRLARLHVVDRVKRPITVDRSALPWYDRWIGWDRLRFLATIRIFVPAYTSLTLTVLYLNAVVWYNSSVAFLNAQISRAGAQPGTPPLPTLAPTWTHALVLANFACLAVAATCFLGCPARVVEFSRERWLNEFQQPEILYDHATWQRPLTRTLCAGALLGGGLLSAFLLVRGILQQATYIVRHIG
jgi:uncharacterized protein YjbI with pentapeptide repeats